MDLRLKGKLVFVSGSTKGIGRSIAEALLGEGARVIINGRSGTNQVVAELASQGEVIAIEGDLSSAEDTERICNEIVSHGQLDILINNMGIFNPRPFAEITDDEWHQFLDVNLLSTVRLSRYFFPKMLDQDFARIINIASEAGMRGLESMVHYSVTKGAQIVLGRGLANLTQGSGRDITVNSVLPGPTLTAGVSSWLKESAEVQGKSEQEFVSEFFKETEPDSLLQRFIKPEEIASVVAFIASPHSAAINGASIRAEGGLIKSIA